MLNIFSSIDKEFIFPILSVILSLGASIVYINSGNIVKGVYWLLGGAITIVVTWFMR